MAAAQAVLAWEVDEISALTWLLGAGAALGLCSRGAGPLILAELNSHSKHHDFQRGAAQENSAPENQSPKPLAAAAELHWLLAELIAALIQRSWELEILKELDSHVKHHDVHRRAALENKAP